MTRAPNLRFCRARQNRISVEHGVNHWIPFTEEEVGARDCFASHFMGDFLKGNGAAGVRALPFGRANTPGSPHQMELRTVFATGESGCKHGAKIDAPLDRLAYYRSHELGKTWYDVADPRDVLSLAAIEIADVDKAADRRSLKDIFRRLMPVRNLSDGRLVCFPVAAAKKLRLLREVNVPGIAHAFGRLLAQALPAWSEKEADIPNHKRHRNAYAYHHYISKILVGGGEFYVRFAVREDVSAGTRNEVHDAVISNIVIYKAKGAELSDPGLSRVEGSTPFVDNKIALFLSAVNGGAENDGQTGFAISTEARAVLDAGRELWRYYHAQPGANPNASYYDIRKHFQGMKTTASGKEQMNATSGDAGYNERLAALKAAMKRLAAKIEPKVYEYGFLRK